MIARISGVLEALEGDTAIVEVGGGLAYAVLLPAYVASRLADRIGAGITLHTLHFIEAPSQGAIMHPRLAGFLSSSDRRFFSLLTSCRGIGPRKALRSMALDVGRIATAIADRDIALLQSLPEIGKRTAETIVATLSGKVESFAVAATLGDPDRSGGAAGAGGAVHTAGGGKLAREALEVLLQLGENRLQAVGWIDEALGAPDAPDNTQALVTRVYQIKSGG